MATHDNEGSGSTLHDRLASIVVPVDGSPESLEAIDYAEQFRADRLLILRVEVDEPLDGQREDDAYTRWRREHIDTVTRQLEEQVRQHVAAADTVEYRIRYGNPAEQIMAEGQEHDLVVMSSSGKGAAGRALFGSVTDRVVRFGITPTLVIRASRHRASAGAPERVVVPLDGSELAERAIPVARRVARTMSLPVHLVRCVGMDEVLQTVREMRAGTKGWIYNIGDDPYEMAQERTDTRALEYLEGVRDRLVADGLEATVERLGGTASFELLTATGARDLVVMTSRGQGGIQRWMLGSVSEKLLREANAPVLLVPVGRTGTEGLSSAS